MELIRTKTTIPVPYVYSYSMTTNDTGYPYLLLEAVPKKALDSQIAFSIPDKHRRNVAAQLARYIYELSNIRFSQIGRILYSPESDLLELLPFSAMGSPASVGPLSTSLEYFYFLRRRQTKAILQEHRGELDRVGGGCLIA